MFCRRLFGARCTIPFADDTQSCDTCPVISTCIQSTLTSLSSCINDLAALFSSLRLQLNPTKSEFIWFGSRIRLAKIPSNMRVLSICGSTIDSADVVRDLGVYSSTANWRWSIILARSFLLFLPPSKVVAAPRQGHPGDHEAAGDVASTESYRLL